GDCMGVTVNNESRGHLTVRSYITESAVISGATVLPGGALELRGISNGEIVVLKGGKLALFGVANGTVRALGGTVEVDGILGHLHAEGGNIVIRGTVGSISGDADCTIEKG